MKKILMLILDGFGLREETKGNAVKLAKMDCFNKLWDEYPHSVLEASGEAVGLPENIFGNSEVCHQVIGLGKKIKHKITIAHETIASKKVLANEELIALVNHVLENDSTLHLMGLVSKGGVHSHLRYIMNLIPCLKEMGVKKLIFHVITDGRDTHPQSSLSYIYDLTKVLKENELGAIGTICGRYYAMDRDNRYERTKLYYDLVTLGQGLNVINLENAINNCYLKGITDEFLPPLLLKREALINEHDGLLWLNFRTDRSRQIINAFTNPEFEGFPNRIINNLKVCTLFPELEIKHANSLFDSENEDLYPISEYFADLKFTQARIAESEKYSHVTKFFNSEKALKYKGMDTFKIESPKVANYAVMPLMSADEVANTTIKCLEKDYDFILTNFCNPDILGHTGNLEATITALEGLDKILAEVIASAEDNFYKVIILSDHGNADTMLGNPDTLSEDGDAPVTSHSMAPVPFILMDKHVKLKEKGTITMVIPTLLEYVDIAIPKEMKETKSLIVKEI